MIRVFSRILLMMVAGYFLLSPAMLPETWHAFAQSAIDPGKPKGNSGAKRKKKSDSTATNKHAIPLPVGITGGMLQGFGFATPIINRDGKLTSRKNGQALYFIESVSGASLEMTFIPTGTYWMGSTDDDIQGALADSKRYSPDATIDIFKEEQPRHQVRVRSFYMGRYDVTIGQWKAVMGDIPERMKTSYSKFKESDNQPVVEVSWNDAQEFCRRLSQATGRQYRLPSEAEWEYAARAGTTTLFAFGETITPEIVNYHSLFPFGNAPEGTYRFKTTVVGSLGTANAFGLYDMEGNVWQWVQDPHHASYDGAPADGSAWESGGDQNDRMLRGGSWNTSAGECRSGLRLHLPAIQSSDTFGFRVVVSAK